MKSLLIIIFTSFSLSSYSQVEYADSLKNKKTIELDEVQIKTQKDNSFGISRLNNIEGTTIFAGKKSEAIYLQDLDANLASNNSRQIFAKVAGINIFENDGSGSTIGIGGRGLNPNRISNFNTRQNGYDISADALGYPESYYTPPTEAVERIEVLRGAAALQFGTQFGGMINYKFAEAPTNKKISGNFRQTYGSYNFNNFFNQLSGTVKKLSYNVFYQYKHYGGWRERSNFNSQNAFGNINYQFNKKFSIKAEYTFLNYLAQQPGGLTDKQFATNPYIVNRNRNWFKVNWNLFSISSDYKINDFALINLRTFKLNAGRDALGFLGRIDRSDDTSSNRNLLSDKYNNLGAELRYLQRYILNNLSSHFLLGFRYYRGNTIRLQGDGSKSDKADFNFLNPNNLENSSYSFPSSNYAVFAENIFQLNKKWSVTPGLRFEYLNTQSQGYYRILNKDGAGNIILDSKVDDNRQNSRQFVIAGLGTQFKINSSLELYSNFSQNYRSINFNDMRVINPNFQVDPNLKDETGFTTDAGMRGNVKNILYFDLSCFYIQYNNRIGTILAIDSLTYNIIRFRTNVSNSRNKGIECFAELDWVKLFKPESKHKISTFVNTAYINALYTGGKQSAFNNKKVEYVPDLILRTGITYAFKGFSFTGQYSYTSEQFSDATNSIATSNAIYGIIPAYSILDLSAGFVRKHYAFYAGVNNAANSVYFTRRAEGYPGPGIIPADPINFYTTLRFMF